MIQLTFTGQGCDQFEKGMQQVDSFLKQGLDKSLLKLWSCTMPNSDVELWMSGQPIQISFTEPNSGFNRTTTVEPRVYNIENYVVQEYDLGVKREINKSEKTTQIGPRTKDLFKQMKQLVFESKDLHEYHIQANKLIAQQTTPTPNHRQIGTKQVPGKPGKIFKKYGG